ncbi:hypothetical protein M231_03512 [Tremella mesenterica]|uniref:Uncharacterized protein n=1 Tax=Tremella mesenterica TaxID=5217 RepID=A0A4Q1BMT2_TREME|nr:hypothetical protein M231_03512 [Tremella mesenterica]
MADRSFNYPNITYNQGYMGYNPSQQQQTTQDDPTIPWDGQNNSNLQGSSGPYVIPQYTQVDPTTQSGIWGPEGLQPPRPSLRSNPSYPSTYENTYASNSTYVQSQQQSEFPHPMVRSKGRRGHPRPRVAGGFSVDPGQMYQSHVSGVFRLSQRLLHNELSKYPNEDRTELATLVPDFSCISEIIEKCQLELNQSTRNQSGYSMDLNTANRAKSKFNTDMRNLLPERKKRIIDLSHLEDLLSQ